MWQLALAASAFVVFTSLYWILQLTSGLLSTRYFLQLALLASSSLSGLWFHYLVNQEFTGPLAPVASAITILFAVVSFLLLVTKLLLQPGQRMQSLHALSRSFASFTSPTKRFMLKTQDGVRIQAIHLLSELPHPKAVIVCHGGGRSKDIQALVMTCELLAEQYTVFTFDWRGHQESGGFWTGDGTSKLDLKAVVDYVHSQGFDKVGVVGWSFGAWSAIVAGGEYHNIDALVAAAPPPTTLRDAEMARQLFTVGLHWWAWPLRIGLKVMRNFRPRNYLQDLCLEDVIGDLAPIPLLLVCNEYDTAIGAPKESFQRLFERAGEPKEFYILQGRGHIYDWPNSLHFMNLMTEWLGRTL